jgi:hypothetical protein
VEDVSGEGRVAQLALGQALQVCGSTTIICSCRSMDDCTCCNVSMKPACRRHTYNSRRSPTRPYHPLLPASVRMSALALLKMAIHARSGGNLEVRRIKRLDALSVLQEALLWKRSLATEAAASPRFLHVRDMHTRAHSRACAHMRAHAHMRVRAHAHTHMHVRTRTSTHTYTNTRVHACDSFPLRSPPCQVMGLMQGKVQGDTFVVIDSFALPVEGTETRVNAQVGMCMGRRLLVSCRWGGLMIQEHKRHHPVPGQGVESAPAQPGSP